MHCCRKKWSLALLLLMSQNDNTIRSWYISQYYMFRNEASRCYLSFRWLQICSSPPLLSLDKILWFDLVSPWLPRCLAEVSPDLWRAPRNSVWPRDQSKKRAKRDFLTPECISKRPIIWTGLCPIDPLAHTSRAGCRGGQFGKPEAGLGKLTWSGLKHATTSTGNLADGSTLC